MRELKIKNVTWISLIRPDKEELDSLHARFPKIHPIVLEDLLTPTIRQRVENYEHHLYMVLYFPSFIHEERKTVARELDLIILPGILITVQYGEFDTLEDFWHTCEEENVVGDQYGKTPIHLLYYLLRQFFSASLKELEQFQEKIDAVEEEIFSGHEKEVLEDVSILRRNIMDFRRAIKPQQLTLESLTTQGKQIFGEKSTPYLTDLVGEYLKVWDLLENHKEALDVLYETNNSLLTAKINELIRAFTILAFITFVPNIITNVYSMNFKNIPFTGHDTGFWVVLGSMIILSWGVYIILKLRKLI